jgi:hypothetical protein
MGVVGTFFARSRSADPSLFGLRHLVRFVGYRQLQYRGVLTLFQKCQKNDVAVWKFQGVVMGAGIVFVDLTEDSSLVFSLGPAPGPQTQTPYIVSEGQFSTG